MVIGSSRARVVILVRLIQVMMMRTQFCSWIGRMMMDAGKVFAMCRGRRNTAQHTAVATGIHPSRCQEWIARTIKEEIAQQQSANTANKPVV